MQQPKFIPTEVVDRLREIDCEEVGEALGLTIRRHMAHCFLHSDHTPSLGFKRNIWKCFSCGKGGNAITLVMERMGLTFVDACAMLCGMYGIPLQGAQPFSKRKLSQSIRNLQKNNHNKQAESVHFDIEIAKFILNNTELTESGEDFLFTQRRFNPSIVEKCGIHSIEKGDTLFQKLIDRFDKKRLTDSKTISSKGTHIIFPTPALLIPYYDQNHTLIGLQTRYLKDIKTGNPIPKFNRICGSSIRLYNLSILNELQPNERLVVAEGITDCLALLSDGIKSVAIPSATSLPIEDLYSLRYYDLSMVPDRDQAGLSGFISLYRMMLRFGCETTKIDLPNGYKDYCAYRNNNIQKEY